METDAQRITRLERALATSQRISRKRAEVLIDIRRQFIAAGYPPAMGRGCIQPPVSEFVRELLGEWKRSHPRGVWRENPDAKPECRPDFIREDGFSVYHWNGLSNKWVLCRPDGSKIGTNDSLTVDQPDEAKAWADHAIAVLGGNA